MFHGIQVAIMLALMTNIIQFASKASGMATIFTTAGAMVASGRSGRERPLRTGGRPASQTIALVLSHRITTLKQLTGQTSTH